MTDPGLAVKDEATAREMQNLSLGEVGWWDGLGGTVFHVEKSADPEGPYWRVREVSWATGLPSEETICHSAEEVVKLMGEEV